MEFYEWYLFPMYLVEVLFDNSLKLTSDFRICGYVIVCDSSFDYNLPPPVLRYTVESCCVIFVGTNNNRVF